MFSSNLRSVGYDRAERILEIEFRSGGVYRYYDVPEATYRELMMAGSKGRYFIAFIRDSYQYARAA